MVNLFEFLIIFHLPLMIDLLISMHLISASLAGNQNVPTASCVTQRQLPAEIKFV